MGKSLFIAEKPSVAMEFAKALKENMSRHDGYQESANLVVTWCVGHLVTMSYPEVYDEKYKRWSLETLPFIPDTFLYEVIPGVKKQFEIVKKLLLRDDVSVIYVCTDSGREGEYIYRLVADMAGVKDKEQRRVWIDSQTEEEILRGIREAKLLTDYDNLGASAYLRAKEDYLMGINFSRLLTLRYGTSMSSFLGERYCVISVGRVMTCVLGMIVRREREIRAFQKQPFYRVISRMAVDEAVVEGEFRAVEGSAYYLSPKLYKENGFKKREDALELIAALTRQQPVTATVVSLQARTEKKNPPLLYNLAELQNDCSRMFRLSPDQTLAIAQELYEKKLVTYPRTDARVLSTAVAKVIDRNLKGLTLFSPAVPFARQALEDGGWRSLAKTRYVNDKQITDHYALVPTGQGLSALKGLSRTAYGVYTAIVRRFLGIFFGPAQYRKLSLVTSIGGEQFFTGLRCLTDEGYLAVMKRQADEGRETDNGGRAAGQPDQENAPDTAAGEAAESRDGEVKADRALLARLEKLKKGSVLPVKELTVREGETSPPKRYNSGSMILAMENAGQLIEDEELRAQIKGSGIGTSATRAEILKKLVSIGYIALNKKTQILTPTLRGEMVYDVVDQSIRSLLNPELTASWEKGLGFVAGGEITEDEYMEKLRQFIIRRTSYVLGLRNQTALRTFYEAAAPFYKTGKKAASEKGQGRGRGKASAGRGKASERIKE